MRFFSPWRALGAAWLAVSAMSACQAGPVTPLVAGQAAAATLAIDSREGGAATAVVQARLADRHVLAAPYRRQDIHRVRLALVRLDAGAETPLAEIPVSAAQLGWTVSFTHLQAGRTYRVRATAYDSLDHELSVAIASRLDFTVPSVGPLGLQQVPVVLQGGDAPSSAATAPGTLIHDGGYMLKGYSKEIFSAPLMSVMMGSAVDSEGHVYVPSAAEGRVYKIPPTGGPGTVVVSGLYYPADVAVAADGTIFVADREGGRIWRQEAGGTEPEVHATLSMPQAIALAPDGTIFASSGQNVWRVTPDGQTAVFAGRQAQMDESGQSGYAWMEDLRGLTLDRDGNLYVADASANFIWRISPKREVGVLTQNVYFPTDVAFTPTGALYASNIAGVVRVHGSGLTEYAATGFNDSPTSLAAAPDGRLYLTTQSRLMQIH
ncbi:MAG: NHL repeat-containing protein [Candidatus Sericytochromatia bacterium]